MMVRYDGTINPINYPRLQKNTEGKFACSVQRLGRNCKDPTQRAAPLEQVSWHQFNHRRRMFSRAAPFIVPRCHCPSLLACAMRCDSVPVQLCAYTFSAQATNALAPSPGRPCNANPTHAPSPEWSTPWSPPMLSLARTPKPCHHGVHPTAALSMRTHRMPTRAANPCGYGAGSITVSPFARSLTDIMNTSKLELQPYCRIRW